jgi:hypothetical protein
MCNASTDLKSLPRTRLSELTFGNCVTFSIDGEEVFKLIYDKIIEAKTCIYIANYDLDPRLQFVREQGRENSSPKLNSAQDYLIRSPCITEKSIAINNNDDKQRFRNEAYPLQDLLIEKAKQDVEVKIIVWQPRLELRIVPGADQRGLGTRTKEIEIMNELAKRNKIEQNLIVRIDNTAPTITSGHDDKLLS